LVGLPETNVLAVVDEVGEILRVHVETRASRAGCWSCGVVARVKERPVAQAPVVVPGSDLFDASSRLAAG
jgi:hypothetical protein